MPIVLLDVVPAHGRSSCVDVRAEASLRRFDGELLPFGQFRQELTNGRQTNAVAGHRLRSPCREPDISKSVLLCAGIYSCTRSKTLCQVFVTSCRASRNETVFLPAGMALQRPVGLIGAPMSTFKNRIGGNDVPFTALEGRFCGP